MASKFMAFENVASTSSASLDQDGVGERIEMNSNQYPNYQSNNQMDDGVDSSNTYGGGGAEAAEEDDLNENFEEKTEKDVGYRKFIYNNSEQFKSICGGLLLLMGSGIHIVWGIFRVFYLYQCKEENSFFLRVMIWSWYIGAIIGCSCAGYAVLKYRKGHIYAFGGVLLTISGILLMLSDNNANVWLLFSRTIGGYTQGLTYVIVIVHASENATKEFRELLMMMVGAVINYSILVSVLSFFHTEGLFRTGILNGIGLAAFGVVTILITMKHATETVPFILQTNGSELDALQTVAKLKKRPVAARSVHHDFLLLKNQVQDEIDHYGVPNFLTVLLPENRKGLIFCCYGRLCSVLSFNLPLIVMIMLFLRNWVDTSTGQEGNRALQCQYFEAYNNGSESLELFYNRTSHNYTKLKQEEEDREEFENEEKSRPKRYAIEIEKPAFFDNENVAAEVYSMLAKDLNGLNKKRDAKESENGEDKNKANDAQKEADEDKKKANAAQKEADEDKKEATDAQKEADKDKQKANAVQKEADEDKKKAADAQKVADEDKQKAIDAQKEADEAKKKANAAKKKEKSTQNKANMASSNKNKGDKTKIEEPKKEPEETKVLNDEEKVRERTGMAATSSTFFAHLIAILHSRELTLILLAWFIFGTITTLFLYYFTLKRFIYRISLVLSSVLLFTGLFHSFGSLTAIFHICLIVYFNYVTIPIDVFGHCMLADAFPITLKAFSIASVAIVEHLVHILLITLYLTSWFHDSIIVFMCVVAFVSHEIARNLPEKANLPLGEAHQQYQNIDLMLFNDPKSGYNQQQEFI